MTSLPLVAIDARLAVARGTGDTSYWRGLLAGFGSHDFQGKVLLYINDPTATKIPVPDWCEWVVLPGRGRWWSVVTFPLAARKAGATVIHGQYNLSPLVGGRGVTTIHDVSFYISPEWFLPKDRLILQSQIRKTVARARQVITVSETSRREIEQHLPAARGKVSVTPNALGTNITPFPREVARQRVEQELGIEGPFFFTLGTVWPRKNTQLAIRAMGLLGDLPHKLVVTGKPGWGDLPGSDRAIFTGYLSDEQVSLLYSAADLYLCPSLHEGFGIPLLEAFACSCPVICGSGGALPEVAGTAALVLESYEPSAWAQAIKAALADSGNLEARRLAGLERVKDFSWVTTAGKTLEIYREASR